MDQNERISDLFKAHHKKVETPPSAAVWERLEARLDARDAQAEAPKRTGRIHKLTPYAAAAAILLLIVAGIGLWDVQREGTQTAPFAAYESPSTATPPLAEVHRTTEAAQTIEETADETETRFEAEDAAQAEHLKTLAAAQAQKSTKEISLEDIQIEEVPEPILAEVEEETEANYAIPEAAGKQARTESTYLANNQGEIKARDAVKLNNRNYAAPPRLHLNPKATKDARAIAKEDLIAESEARHFAAPGNSTLNHTPPKMTRKRAAAPQTQSAKQRAFGQLEWLVGKWEDRNAHEGVSYEEWTHSSEFVLTGNGYYVLDGDRIFYENMQIMYMRSADEVFLIMQVAANRPPLRYRLLSAGAYKAVFLRDIPDENPDKITLQRSRSDKKLTVELSNSHQALEADQQIFLQHRNLLSNQRAKRRLHRSK